MGYLDEFERIKGRSRSQSVQYAQTEALLYIAKCLSYMVDSDIKDEEESKERLKKLEFDPSKCVESIYCGKGDKNDNC